MSQNARGEKRVNKTNNNKLGVYNYQQKTGITHKDVNVLSQFKNKNFALSLFARFMHEHTHIMTSIEQQEIAVNSRHKRVKEEKKNQHRNLK
jgi:hypothetical protein